MSKWSHLPNANHIDGVLASVKAHPQEWHVAWDPTPAWGKAEMAAVLSVQGEPQTAATQAAVNEVWSAVTMAGWGAILALIAYDNCAKYLKMSSDELRVWITLSENPAAILLLPAVLAYEKIKEAEHV